MITDDCKKNDFFGRFFIKSFAVKKKSKKNISFG